MNPESISSVPETLREPLALWWERAGAEQRLLDAYAALPETLRAELPRVAAGSEFAAMVLIRDPSALEWLGRNDEPSAAQSASSGYEHRTATAPTAAETLRTLREWRRREMLRIAWRDIAGRAPVIDTLRALSDFADSSIRAAAAAAERQMRPVFGTPRDSSGEEVPLIVLGMGKLGGRELNFSSDIDLILLFGQAGETDGPRAVENEEYFNRLGRELIRLLDVRNEDGFVFRVDMRLRPFGDSGPLTSSLASLETYLQEHGRDWERYAWIKARAIVGIEAYARAYGEFVRPFVYRRYLDFGVIESLRDMKALIAREVSRRELDQDLKLGRGGIREIEFIVQSMQLVRGGSNRRLQNATNKPTRCRRRRKTACA
jgi:glutamate-ammonia-ligase adenylyltransferase